MEANLFRRWHSCNYICDGCMACKHLDGPPALNYRNFAPNAGHLATLVDHEAYLLTEGSSPWLRVPGWRLEMAWSDLMHIVHLGIAGGLVSNTI
eukprot:9204759-Alexandrium_andersonii.AAC.1